MHHDLIAAVVPIGDFQWSGDFTMLDLIAASTNALNGALLARRPDHYKQYTVVGILLMALVSGLTGGIIRDMLLGDVPSALTNPAYITVAFAFGVLGYSLAYGAGELFREGFFQFMTSFSLPWFAIVGAQAGADANVPVLGCMALAVIAATAGRYFIDLTSGVTPKQFIRSEWYIGAAVITGATWLVCDSAGLSTWAAAAVAFTIGFTFRLLALYRGWEEPLPKEAKGVVVHSPGNPLLGRKLAGKSKRELAELGLSTEPAAAAGASEEKPKSPTG